MFEQVLPAAARPDCPESNLYAHHRHYCFFETAVHISSNHEDFFGHFNLLFGEFHTTSAEERGPAFAVWISDLPDQAPGEHRLYCNGELIYRTYDYLDIFLFLEWQICGLITRSDRYLLVHAGLVAKGGKGILLSGPSGAGKTTLVASLVLRDFDYITDEMVVVDPTEAAIRPFPRTLTVEAEALSSSPDLLDRLREKSLGQKRPFWGNRWFLDTTTGEGISQIKAVLFPAYEPTLHPAMQELSRAQGVFELTQNTFNLSRFQEGGLDLLLAICRNARFYRLRTANLDETMQLVEHRVWGDHASHAAR